MAGGHRMPRPDPAAHEDGDEGRGGARLVPVRIARRRFALSGGTSHGFAVPLNSRGRRLARLRGTMRAQLIVAIPGGRVTRAVTLR